MLAHRAESLAVEIGIDDIVNVALNLQYLHFAGIKDAGPETPVNDAERIKRYFGGFRYPMDLDAELVEWSTERGALNTFL